MRFSILIALVFCMVSVKSYSTADENTTVPKDLIKREMNWDGYDRTFYIHLPPAEKMNKPLPLVFNLHGGGGRAVTTPKLIFNRFNQLADRDGFIVIYPQGVGKQWNDGRKSDQVQAWRENIDDVGFISEIVNVLKSEYTVDMNQIFTTGISNGGFMSTRLACERSDLFRGAAIITAQISEDFLPFCDSPTPMGILIMNGTEDPLVPYDGGEVEVLGKKRGKVISTDNYVSLWKGFNDCKSVEPSVELPNISKRDQSTITKTIYSDCAEGGALELYSVVGGGHTWPGGKQYLPKRLVGYTNRDINACNVIWNFFRSLD